MELEAEANTFLQNTLIPTADYNEFLKENVNGFSEDVIIAFSKKINILPGIVVGRLQQDDYLPYQASLNRLKIKYRIE